MSNIVLTRIDQRLIHAQVTLQWCGALNVEVILVVNDEVANNLLRQNLMRKATPNHVEVIFTNVEDAIHKIQDNNQRLFILCENPFDALKLIEANVSINKINIGNISISDAEKEAYKKLYSKGIELEIKSLPHIASEDIQLILK